MTPNGEPETEDELAKQEREIERALAIFFFLDRHWPKLLVGLLVGLAVALNLWGS